MVSGEPEGSNQPIQGLLYLARRHRAGQKNPPNNWRACFGGSAWEYEEATGQFYLHLFSRKQPDLNWDNPKVREEVAAICNDWLEKEWTASDAT